MKPGSGREGSPSESGEGVEGGDIYRNKATFTDVKRKAQARRPMGAGCHRRRVDQRSQTAGGTISSLPVALKVKPPAWFPALQCVVRA